MRMVINSINLIPTHNLIFNCECRAFRILLDDFNLHFDFWADSVWFWEDWNCSRVENLLHLVVEKVEGGLLHSSRDLCYSCGISKGFQMKPMCLKKNFWEKTLLKLPLYRLHSRHNLHLFFLWVYIYEFHQHNVYFRLYKHWGDPWTL